MLLLSSKGLQCFTSVGCVKLIKPPVCINEFENQCIKNAVAPHGLCSNLQNSLSVYSAQDKDVSHRYFSFCVLSPRPAWRCILGETFFCACQAYILWLRHTPVPPWPASDKTETLGPVNLKAHQLSANH